VDSYSYGDPRELCGEYQRETTATEDEEEICVLQENEFTATATEYNIR
jgi:hypothetical protein